MRNQTLRITQKNQLKRWTRTMNTLLKVYPLKRSLVEPGIIPVMLVDLFLDHELKVALVLDESIKTFESMVILIKTVFSAYGVFVN